jgi:competence/damage-inducible protein CinA-like protein
MPSAELIAIGTELLLGEIQDTNSHFLARQLRDIGVDLFRITSIGDNASRIASAIKEAMTRADIVITTGGLGPTVDDPTRDAAALAFDTTCEYHPELWAGIEDRFLRRGITPTENNKRQAYLPTCATLIPNSVGTAPAFYIENSGRFLFCLPGVPKEMEFLTAEAVLPKLIKHFNLRGVIQVRVIHLSGVGESAVDQPISEFERMSNPTVGLLAHPGIVDIRITAKADDRAAAAAMIKTVEEQIVALFPDDICGYDDQTPAQNLLQLLKASDLKLHIQSFGLSDQWAALFSNASEVQIENSQAYIDFGNLSEFKGAGSTLEFFCNYFENGRDSHLDFLMVRNGVSLSDSMIYNGPQAQGKTWAINRAMDALRRKLISLSH